jgi:ParB family transcriptional regulator, chromosome partitioning protein
MSSLGKGLESLIPKKNPNDNMPASGQGKNAQDAEGVAGTPQQNPVARSADADDSPKAASPLVEESDLMLEGDEPVMLFTRDDVELPAGEDMLLSSEEPLKELEEGSSPSQRQGENDADGPDTMYKSNKRDGADTANGGHDWLPKRQTASNVSGLKSPTAPQGKNINKPYEAVFHIEVSKIRPNSQQPRRFFDAESLKELGHSIQEFGILQPLVVTKKEIEVPSGTDVEYELIAGERRLEAAKLIGLERVPAVIKSYDLERERLEMAIVENLQRENLSPIEMARAFSRLQDEFRLTQREIASRLGKSREAVANTMRLLDLPPYIQEAVDRKQITESHGRLLLSIADPAAQERLFHDLQQKKMTTREFKRRVEASREKSHAASDESDPALEALQARLSSELGAPVKISGAGETGKITISFYSKEELDSILNKLNAGE